MTPQPAKIWQMPRLLRILWSFTRATPWLPRHRPVWVDAQLMGRIIRQGWVRQVNGAAFIARDRERIHALYVHPASRRQGLGRRLLNDAKSRSDRLELWVLERNLIARKFYAAQGFKEVDFAPEGLGNDENMPDIKMIWTSNSNDGAPHE